MFEENHTIQDEGYKGRNIQDPGATIVSEEDESPIRPNIQNEIAGSEQNVSETKSGTEQEINDPGTEPESETDSKTNSEPRSLSPETYRVVNNYISKRRRRAKRKRRANTVLGIIVLLLLLWVIFSFLMKYNVITFIPWEFSIFSVFSNLAAYWENLKTLLS